MQQIAKRFSIELNKCLDDLEIPTTPRERANILSKMLDIPKQNAWALIEGQIYPDEELLKKINAELELDTDQFKKSA